MRLGALELIPHPESDVGPLKLEKLLAGLYSIKGPLSFEVVYSGKYIRLYIVGPEEVLRNLRKSLKTIYGKVIIEDAKPPSLKAMLATSECLEYDDRKKRYRVRRGCSWYVAELKLSRPIYYVLVKHSEKNPIETNPIDIILASMKPRTYVQIIFTPEPSGRSIIADWVGSKLYGTSSSIPKEMLRIIVEDPTVHDYRYRYEHYKYLISDTERDRLKQAQLKMASPLFAVRIRVYADSKDKVNEVASSFNQFSGNSFKFKVREVKDKDLEIAEERIPLKLRWFFKDKRSPILSARELALFVNLPTPTSSLPLRTGYVALEPPPELRDLGFVKHELSVGELERLVSSGSILLGLHGSKGYGIGLEEFRRAHKAVFGTTGAGKSSFARYLMMALLAAYGCGNVSIVYIDPNGDDALKLLKLLLEECVDNVVYIDPRTTKLFRRVVKVNFLEYRDDYERKYLVEAFLGAIAAYFGRFWGPRTEHLIRMALLLVTSAPPGTYSLVDLYRVFEDESLRARFLEYVDDEKVITFWTHDFPAIMKSRSGAEAIQSVKNKLGKFVNDPLIRSLIDARRSSVDLREAVDSGKIVIVNLGALKGTDSLAFMGAMVLSRILVAAFSRGLSGEVSRRPVFVFIDELHNFVSPMLAKLIAQMMAETRKFNVFIVAMTQYPKQLPPTLRSALYELARHLFVFQVGLESAKELRKVFEPYLGETDLMNIDPYHHAARLKLGAKTLRPFTLKAPYIPVELEGSNVYLDDPVISRRISRSLQLYGREVVEFRPRGLSIKYGPRPYFITYKLTKEGKEVPITKAVELVSELVGSRDFFEAVEQLRELVREGLASIEEGEVVLTDEALRLFKLEFPETKHSGGELHKSVIKSLAEELLSKQHYVWVDTSGSMEAPDIVVVPASSDLSEWLYDRATCYEVESDPMKHTTFDKLVQILRRCYRAGCSRIAIVVPDTRGKEVVESRLKEVMSKSENVSVAMSIPREWLEEVEVEVRTLAKESKAEVKPKESNEEVSEEDLGDKFLEWVKDKAIDLVAIGAFIVDKDSYILATEVARRFSQEVGRRVSLKELADILSRKYPGVEYKGMWLRGGSVRVLKIPRELLKSK